MIESDERGLLVTCPKCGQRNRLKYDRLKQAPRCGKCHAELRAPNEPIDITNDLAFNALVVKVNTENLPNLARLFHINAIPTMMLFKDGMEVARQVGAMAAPAIRKFLEPWIGVR